MDDLNRPGTPQQAASVALSVVCGHLAFARYPVLVGHYSGDTFAGTEARLDRALDGCLSRRRRMGLYPGPIGTSTVALNPEAAPPGAIVVGLGEPAGLSIGALRKTLRRGILAFAADTVDHGRAADGAALRLSTLMIGAGEGGLDLGGCAEALLQAAGEAQAVLHQVGEGARLDAIEIVEVFEDRAAATWRSLEQILTSNPALGSRFALLPGLELRRGRRASAPVGRDPSWWQPIQITMSGEARERSLSFTISGGHARAEARTIAANLELVAPLVRRVARSGLNDETSSAPGRALFELLWPAALKDQSTDERHRRLILDAHSAGFPWELLDDRRPWMSSEAELTPPAARAGIVRQLLQTRFREEVVTTSGTPKALVIGNPQAAPTHMPDLPGAENEARTVAGLLKATHDVEALIGAQAGPEQISRRLFTEAWEIIHISAHGVSGQPLAGPDGKKRKMTGIVLGGGVVLGPSALSKLPVSPGIAFINCCHLGIGQPGLDGRPEFAANVAVELVKLGARCVIAAGWAVDDRVAAVFARSFYEEMLDGQPFGLATLTARRRAFESDPQGNTWGAYQCYGDPDYRLRVPASAAGRGNGRSDLVSISEAVDAALRIADDLNMGLERDTAALRGRIETIEAAGGERDWLSSADLRIALARARRELGHLPEAIAHYEAAVAHPDSAFSVKAIEQLARLSVRHAVASLRTLPPQARDPVAAAATIRAWLGKIEELTRLLGETRARLSLQGGCWKGLAQVQPAGDDVDAALEKMAGCYARAAEIEEPGDRSYPLLMACTAAICRAVRTGNACDASVADRLGGLIDTAPCEGPDVRHLILQADARMTDAILRCETLAADQPDLLKAYARAWRHPGSPAGVLSIVERFDFYEDIFSSGNPATCVRRESIVSLARSLRDTLAAEGSGAQQG